MYLSPVVCSHCIHNDPGTLVPPVHVIRPVWFDLEPSPPSSEGKDEGRGESDGGGEGGDDGDDGDGQQSHGSQALLRSWGFFELASSSHDAPFRVVADERGSGVVTVQCHVLESFLEVCARLVGIDLRLGVAYEGVCAASSDGIIHAMLATPQASARTAASGRGNRSSGIFLANPQEPLVVAPCADDDGEGGDDTAESRVPFDLLLGADGPRSAVRSSIGLAYPARSAFSTAGGELSRTPSELSQVTLIVSFALDNATGTGRCPQPRRDAATGLPDAPYEVSFDEPGVSSVFKRLYEPYCELQVRALAACARKLHPAHARPIR